MLTAGTRLGPYEVVGAIGARGMGEVYSHRIAVERLGEDGTQLWLIDVVRGLTTRADVGSDPVSAPVRRSPRGESSTSQPRVLFKTGLVGDPSSQRFVATADGSRFLFNMLPEGDRAATTTTLQVVLNWTKGLAR